MRRAAAPPLYGTSAERARRTVPPGRSAPIRAPADPLHVGRVQQRSSDAGKAERVSTLKADGESVTLAVGLFLPVAGKVT